MKIVSFILLGVLFSLFTYCQSASYSNKINKYGRNFVLKESKKMVQDSVLFKSITVIPLEADAKKYAGGEISRIYFDRDTFFILSKSFESINIYNKEGHYIKTIGTSDQGPQVFRELADICVDRVNKELIVLTSEPSKVLFYSYQGDFLRESPLSTYYESIATDGKFIYLQDNNVVKGEKEITIYSRNMKDKKEALEVSHQFKGRETGRYIPFVLGRTMTQDTIIHLTQYFNNKIYTAGNGNVSLEYTLDFKESSLPNTLLEKKMRPSEFLEICRKHNYVFSIAEVIENSKYLLFNTNVGLCVCNKESGDITKYNEIVDSTTGYVINQIQTVGNTNNKMAIVWPLTFIKNSKILPVKETSIYNQIKETASKQSLEIDDRHNSILVIYEF